MRSMKVKVAKTAGFCFGVKRAVDKVYQLIEEGVSPIYTLGPIIHNEEVVSDLESRGVQVIRRRTGSDQGRYGCDTVPWSRERYLSETQRKQS